MRTLPFVALLLPAGLLATKPCPAPSCETGGKLDAGKCEALADWVVDGTLEDVTHHPQGQPMMKNFATFTLKVTSVAKGGGKPGDRLRFRVGWCENARELPKKTEGRFRFYGTGPRDAERPLYLDFERLRDEPK